jgi:hypothetical protein
MPQFIPHSALRTRKKGQRGRTCTCDPSVPSRVRWLLRYALVGPGEPRTSEHQNAGHKSWRRSCGKLSENGGPEGTCTLSLPADNGLLWLFELRILYMRNADCGVRNESDELLNIPRSELRAPHSKWWEVLVTLQFVSSDILFRHRIYRPAAGE